MTYTTQDRIRDNIRAQAKAFVEYGDPMPKRGPQWDELVEQALKEAHELYKPKKKRINRLKMSNEELIREIERRQRALAKKMNMDYDEWLEKANKFYKIEKTEFGYTVISSARSPKEEYNKEYYFSSEWEAKEKVLKLISYKYYDHFHKGCDFKWESE